MKYLVLIALFLSTLNLISQDFGGGEYFLDAGSDQCLDADDRNEILLRIENNRRQLELEGILSPSPDRSEIDFIWPLKKAAGFEWNSYYGISNYVDQNTDIDALGDYYCNERTYDGHKGTDIFTWPFPWYMYENDLVEVIAGAPGVIIEKDDGFDDDHCECFGSWNAVYVQHDDGSVAWYGHMKRNSLTEKEVGDYVEQGEFLGIVASSGCSTGPHLHLEVYDSDVNLIDPYAGDCNDLNVESWWEVQPENREPTLNVILTHDAVPEHGCPLINEDPHLNNEFYPGDLLYTAFYFHDATVGTVANYRIKMPDGTVWQEWSNTSPATYNASWWYWFWTLPEAGPFGIWSVEGDYMGETVIHEFSYGVYADIDEIQNEKILLYPNPVNEGVITIIGMETSVTEVEIFDASGRKVMVTKVLNGKINVTNLNSGIYYVKLNMGSGILTRKITITK